MVPEAVPVLDALVRRLLWAAFYFRDKDPVKATYAVFEYDQIWKPTEQGDFDGTRQEPGATSSE